MCYWRSVGVYFAALEHLNDFIDQSQSTTKPSTPRESEEQLIAREARELRREQARLRKQIDDEWLLKGFVRSKSNRFQHDREFSRRWAEHPIEKARKAREQAEHAALRPGTGLPKDEAILALVSLGYGLAKAAAVVSRCSASLGEGAQTAALLRAAFRELGQWRRSKARATDDEL